MALVYDIEKDPLYQEGELKAKVKGIKKALDNKKLTPEEIAEVFEVSLDFVLKVQKGEIV